MLTKFSDRATHVAPSATTIPIPVLKTLFIAAPFAVTAICFPRSAFHSHVALVSSSPCRLWISRPLWQIFWPDWPPPVEHRRLPGRARQLPDLAQRLLDRVRRLPGRARQLVDLARQLPDPVPRLPDRAPQLPGRARQLPDPVPPSLRRARRSRRPDPARAQRAWSPEALPSAVVSRLACSELRRPYRQSDSHLCLLYPPWSAARSLPQPSFRPSEPPRLPVSA